MSDTASKATSQTRLSPTTVSRFSWNLRNQFSDWLWRGAANGKRMRHWWGKILPWYLSDPEAHYLRKKLKIPGWLESLEPATTVGPPESPWIISDGNHTISGAAGSTIYLQWRDPK